MSEYDEETYGKFWAELYDDEIIGWPSAATQVAFLKKYIFDDTALDLGSGTGRVAAPLVDDGVRVTAVDTSAEMLAKARAKVPSDNLELVNGRIEDLQLDRKYSLVYCVGQSLLQIQTQEGQLRALQVMSEHVHEKGHVVIEGLTPDIRRFRVGQDFLTNKVLADRVLFSASLHDPRAQQIKTMMFDVRPTGFTMHPSFIRYLWHSELVLLADKAGLEHVASYASWSGRGYQGGPGAYAAVFVSKEVAR